MQDNLKWDDLRAFLAVARGGTLAAASSALSVNASTVHRRVAALEQALEAELFVRDPRGYALTEVGEALVPRAEEVEEAVLSLRRAATGHDRTARGPVTLTIVETLVSVIAPQLATVRERCPGLQPILRAENRLLSLGTEADVAIRPSVDPPPTAVGRRICKLGWSLYGPAHEAGEVPWVIYAPGEGPTLPPVWRRRHHPDVPVLMSVTSVPAMHRVLCCTRAQGLLPCYLGDPEPKLARRADVIDEIGTDLWLLIHADLRRSARVRALVDLLWPQLEAARPLLEGR